MPNFLEQLTRELSQNKNVMTFSDASKACAQASVGASFAGKTLSPAVLVPACAGGVVVEATGKFIDATKDLATGSSSSAPKNK